MRLGIWSLCLAAVLLMFTGAAQADLTPGTYTQTLTWAGNNVGPTWEYTHKNPAETTLAGGTGGPLTAADWAAAAAANQITAVTLAVQVAGLSSGESLSLKANWVADAPDAGFVELGPITADSGNLNVFDLQVLSGLNTGGLDGLPLHLLVTGGNGKVNFSESVLTVTIGEAAPPVPVPGAALLGCVGLAIVGWLKRRIA